MLYNCINDRAADDAELTGVDKDEPEDDGYLNSSLDELDEVFSHFLSLDFVFDFDFVWSFFFSLNDDDLSWRFSLDAFIYLRVSFLLDFTAFLSDDLSLLLFLLDLLLECFLFDKDLLEFL